jgi:glycine cleavage system regulatory protein
MKNSEANPLADSLIYEDLLPLTWTPRDEGFQAVNSSRINEHNEHVLRCVNLLGEQIKEKVDEEAETESALIRLEAKVNLILEMLSSLDRERGHIPDPIRVKLAAGGIEWLCNESPPAAGDSIWIKLYIDNRVPEAMQLPAQVLTVSPADQRSSMVCARFEEIGESVQDQMEKMIFRHHRRMVAQSKSA